MQNILDFSGLAASAESLIRLIPEVATYVQINPSSLFVDHIAPMALDIFRAILCCCQPSDQSDDYETFDETMHLIIPETPEAMVG